MHKRSARGRASASIAEKALMSAISDYGWQIFAVSDAEVRKLRHDSLELATRAVQPALWLLLFGQVMAQVRGITSGGTRYLDFLVPGILGQSVLFVAIFYGINTIWERDLGVLHRYLVSPAPRSALVLGKALSSTVRGLSQAIVVYALALILGIQVSFQVRHVLWRDPLYRARRSSLLHLFGDCGLHRTNPGAVPRHRASADDAHLFRQQRYLSDPSDASLAADYLSPQSANLRSRCAAWADATHHGKPDRTPDGLRGASGDICCSRRDCGAPLPQNG